MSALPDFTGPGFFAGEAPDGLTTIAGTPTSAQVRVYWRDPSDPQAPDALVASTQSAADGTWQIAGLNPALRYVVRAQKSQFDDVTVVGAVPSRSDVIAYVGQLVPHENEFGDVDGLTGYVLLDSGLPPFTCEVIQPLPYGLTARIEGRKLLIEGVSSDAGLWESVVRVTASNGVWVDVSVQVRIAWSPASLDVLPKIWLDWSSDLSMDSGFAGAWSNRGRLGGAFSQSVARRRPTAVTSDFAVRFLRFDGIDDGLTSNSLRGVLRAVSHAWSLIVFKKRTISTAGDSRAILSVPSGGAITRGRYVIGLGHGGANRLNVIGRSSDSDSEQRLDDPAATTTEWQIRFNSIDYASGLALTVTNGAAVASTPSLTLPGATSNTDSRRHVAVGSWVDAGSSPEFPIDADIALVMLDSTPLSFNDRQRLEGWAAHQCGLTAALPSDHPYKEVAP